MNKGKQSIDRKFKNSKNDIDIVDTYNTGNIDIGNDQSTNNYNTTNNYYLTEFDCHFPAVDSMENSNNRTLLKSMVNKNIKIWGYAMNEYKRIPEENIVRFTVINIHTDNMYIADHIQLQIPYEIYHNLDNGEDIRHKILMIDGVVKEYETSFGYKQTILANKMNVSYANNMDVHKDYIKLTHHLNDKQEKEVLNKYGTITAKDRFELLINYIEELNHLLPRMPRDFISNYIINQYMINYDPDSINDRSLDMIKNDAKSLMEITFLIITIIKNISDGANSINAIFRYINWILNDMQGLKEENVEIDRKLRVLPFSDRIEKTEFEKFCDKHSLNPKKAYRFILNRNINFNGGVINKIDAMKKAIEVLYLDMVETKQEESESDYL